MRAVGIEHYSGDLYRAWILATSFTGSLDDCLAWLCANGEEYNATHAHRRLIRNRWILGQVSEQLSRN